MVNTKKILIVSVCLNIIFCIVLCADCNKSTVVESGAPLTEVSSMGGDESSLESVKEEYDYHNPGYDELLSFYKSNHEKYDIVFAGDSITRKYLLQEFFPKIETLNRGINSDVSEGLLNRFDEVLSHEPKKIFIWIGINDISCGIDVGDTINNVKECIEKAKERETSVYVLSVLPTNKGMNEDVMELNEKYEQLCAQENVVFINLYDSYVDDDGDVILEFYDTDGVHLNLRGYKVASKVLFEYVYDK